MNLTDTNSGTPSRSWVAVFTVMALVATMVMTLPAPAQAAEITYRINAGGAELGTNPVWSQDTTTNPSPFSNIDLSGQNNTFSATAPLDGVDGTVPVGTPSVLFLTMRWDPPGGGGGLHPELEWNFPVANGPHEVRLYFAETDKTEVGQRVFDVSIEGALVLPTFDVFAEAGFKTGTMRSFEVDVTDGNLNVAFGRVVDNPFISGIEIIDLTPISVSPDPIELTAEVGSSATQTVTVTNTSDDTATVESTQITGSAAFSDDYPDTNTDLAPGSSLTFDVTFNAPAAAGIYTASLEVTVDGTVFEASIIGTATAAALPASLGATPTSVNFGTVQVGSNSTQTVTISHQGTTGAPAIVIDSITVAGGAFDTDASAPVVVSVGGSVDVDVTFAPSGAGPASGTLVVSHDGSDSPLEVSLFGEGSTAPPGEQPSFADIGDSIFQQEILWLAGEGITRGCNPPANTLFCPTDFVTRGQMAAFLHRALDGILTPGATVEFIDDDTSVFEADIEWLAATGVTRGCNPPTNDSFCPDDPVTRGQMAAFLHRALGDVLTPGAAVEFIDDDSSVFEADIEWLAATGVTRGCNPPTNDRFCPDDPVTREQMAAFLFRALG